MDAKVIDVDGKETGTVRIEVEDDDRLVFYD